jgi:hypothetical protein
MAFASQNINIGLENSRNPNQNIITKRLLDVASQPERGTGILDLTKVLK